MPPCHRPAPSVPGRFPDRRQAALLLLAFGLILGACLDSSPRQTELIATIVRIEQPDGDYYSPRLQGPSRPLTKIFLRPADDGGPTRPPLVIVAVLGPYAPARLGGPGDLVALTYPGPIPPGREVALEDVSGYRVIGRSRGQAAGALQGDAAEPRGPSRTPGP